MHIPWVNIPQPMTKKEADWWERRRTKGRLLWTLRDIVISILVLSVIYGGYWAIGWGFQLDFLLIWIVFYAIYSLYSWSAYEDQYHEYKLSAIMSDDKLVKDSIIRR